MKKITSVSAMTAPEGIRVAYTYSGQRRDHQPPQHGRVYGVRGRGGRCAGAHVRRAEEGGRLNRTVAILILISVSIMILCVATFRPAGDPTPRPEFPGSPMMEVETSESTYA